jgi:hypothetical protein
MKADIFKYIDLKQELHLINVLYAQLPSNLAQAIRQLNCSYEELHSTLQPGHRLPWLKFVKAFLSPSRNMPGGHERFFPSPFQLIIHCRPFIQRHIV